MHFNVLKNKGYYLLKIAFVNLLCGRVRFNDGALEFENNNDLLFSKKENEKYLNIVFKNILKKIDVKECEVFCDYGNTSNACNTALICGGLYSFVSCLFAKLKTKFQKMYQFLDVKPNYNKDIIETTVNIEVTITIFQTVISLIKSKFELKRG